MPDRRSTSGTQSSDPRNHGINRRDAFRSPVRILSLAAVFALLALLPGCGSDETTQSPIGDQTPPAAVTNLMAGLPGDLSISLIWTAPGDDGMEGTAEAYDLRYAQDDITEESFDGATAVSQPPTPAPAGRGEAFTVTGLTEATTYFFALRARDEAGNWSALSNTVSLSTRGGAPADDQTAPAPVTDLAAGSPAPNSLTLTWTATGDDGSSGNAFRYDLRYAFSAITTGEEWDTATEVQGEPSPPGAPGSAESCTVTGLSEDTEYHFLLRVEDEQGNASVFSNRSSARTTGADTTPPAAVGDLEAQPLAGGGIALSWTAPGDDGDFGRADLYDLRYSTQPLSEDSFSEAPAVDSLPLPQAAGAAQGVTVNGLSPQTTYSFALKARDERSNGWSAISNVVRAESGENPMAPDFTLVDRQGQSHALSQYRGNHAVLLEYWATWCAPCRLSLQRTKTYHERYGDSGLKILAVSVDGESSADRIDPFVESQGLPFTVLHDADGSVRSAWKVTAIPRIFLIDPQGLIRGSWTGYRPGDDIASEIEAVLPECHPPQTIDDLRAEQVTSSSVTLVWTAPAVAGALGADSYEIRYDTSPFSPEEFDQATLVPHPPEPQGAGLTEVFSVSGLAAATTYFFAVRSRTFCDSEPSNLLQATTSDVSAPGWHAFPVPLDAGEGETAAQVLPLCRFEGDLIAGGLFRVPGSTARNIARWDGASWHAVFDAAYPVWALVVHDGDLFAAVGDTIVRWDGTHATVIGTMDEDGVIYRLLEYEGDLIAVGTFHRVGLSSILGVARWNGSAWSAMGNGVVGATGAVVFGGLLLAAGSAGVTVWDGAAWQALGSSGPTNTLATDGVELLTAPTSAFGGRTALRWNGESWDPLPPWPFEGYVFSLSIQRGFTLACGTALSDEGARLALWEGDRWTIAGTASGGSDLALFWDVLEYGGGLVVSGSFQQLGSGAETAGLALWIP